MHIFFVKALNKVFTVIIFHVCLCGGGLSGGRFALFFFCYFSLRTFHILILPQLILNLVFLFCRTLLGSFSFWRRRCLFFDTADSLVFLDRLTNRNGRNWFLYALFLMQYVCIVFRRLIYAFSNFFNFILILVWIRFSDYRCSGGHYFIFLIIKALLTGY